MYLCFILGYLKFIDFDNFVARRGLYRQHFSIQLFFFWAYNGIIGAFLLMEIVGQNSPFKQT